MTGWRPVAIPDDERPTSWLLSIGCAVVEITATDPPVAAHWAGDREDERKLRLAEAQDYRSPHNRSEYRWHFGEPLLIERDQRDDIVTMCRLDHDVLLGRTLWHDHYGLTPMWVAPS